MSDFEQIFGNSSPKSEEDKSFTPFDKKAWAEQKKQERSKAFALIDETAQKMGKDGTVLQRYLDVQAHFERYSVGNAVLITAQKPEAVQLADSKTWRDKGVFIQKGESGILLLEPGDEFTREDGTMGVSYNTKKVFDISQTNAKVKEMPAADTDYRALLKALINGAPCTIEISGDLQEGINALYSSRDKKVYVRNGMDASTAFRAVTQELAHAHLDAAGAYNRRDNVFTAYCVTYLMCSRYNIPRSGFRFEQLPANYSEMDARSMRSELSKIRAVANEISADMAKCLEKDRKLPERRDEAR